MCVRHNSILLSVLVQFLGRPRLSGTRVSETEGGVCHTKILGNFLTDISNLVVAIHKKLLVCFQKENPYDLPSLRAGRGWRTYEGLL
jgi:hypothetical protein